MRPLLAAPLLLALAVAACGPRVQYLRTTETVTTTTYPVYYAPPPQGQALMAEDAPPSRAQIEARRQRERQSSRNPIAWSHNGYHYDQWGNLVRVDR